MPIGPSHGARGGRGGDGNRGSSSGGGKLFGAILGGVIGGALTAGASKRRREHYYRGHNHNHYDHHDDYEESAATPSRRKPTRWLTAAIVILFIMLFTVMVRNGFVKSKEEDLAYVANMVLDKEEWENHYEKALSQQAAINAASGATKENLIKTRTHFTTTATFTKGYYPKTSYGANPQNPNYYEYCDFNDYKYYFIVYEFNYVVYDENGVAKTKSEIGTTYAHYTINSVPNGEINIVYFIDDNGKALSTDTYFVNNELNGERGEYGYRLALAEGNKLLASYTIYVIIGELLLIALLVYIYIKKLKKYKALAKQDEEAYTQKQQAEVSEAKAKAEAAQKDADKKNRVCAFCGSTVPDDEPSCPACGSSTFE